MLAYFGGKQTRVRCGAICLIALFVASPDQEKSASKQLAPPLPYTHLLTDLSAGLFLFAQKILEAE